MADFLQAAAGVIETAQQRVQIAAQNISNMTTPGYRRRVGFEQWMAGAGGLQSAPMVSMASDFTPGKQTGTNNPYDLAIEGSGFFAVKDQEQTLYTRDGQFKRDDTGRVVTLKGLAVQADGGGDIILKSNQFKVQADGSIVVDGEPVAKLAVMDFTNKALATPNDQGLFSTPASNVVTAENSHLRQGALESSNVSTGDEMVSIMASLRSAEAGQRLVNVYDDLMGRVISTVGQN